MGLYAHAPCTDIRPQKESAIVCGLLSLCNTPQTLLFEIERVGISLHAGHRSITRYLIIEEEAPVVAIGHGLLSVGKGEPVENVLCHLVAIVEQSARSPALMLTLEESQGQRCLAEFLDDHILIGGMEEVVVLKRPVGIEIWSFVKITNACCVIVWVDHCCVQSVGRMGIAVDGEGAHPLEPLRSQRIIGEKTERSCKYIHFPTIFLCLGVTNITRRDVTLQLVVALSFQQVVDVSLQRVWQTLPLKIGRVSHRHCPKAALPLMILR